ncbi:Na+/H+ antiporter NhaC [Natranaerobius thermophilus]|uniref:Na+/H+ antiporter NhaC n=1 Tax=Natranaerobius thermophilus (strain ATCC BAA-1301 / DSM 18059 / JW/NM-WN-LF) TaxID=457570 RepID=B2A283_NATTJ|nr:Na+/H+ antiporter NhaC [Natranaerobius thermophilus]ACB86191.1 Na+/H+ antiporter NhaC [Natranaerobius thermophilus JW/NM-WN-LF]
MSDNKENVQEQEEQQVKIKPTPAQAFTPMIALIVLIFFSAIILEVDIHIPLFISTIIAAVVAVAWMGHDWETVQEGILKGINFALGAVIILAIVGILIGSWIEGGVVPTIVYYGLQLLSPQIFLVATLVISAVVSVFTGSSWSSIATIGLALSGIGHGMGMPPAMTVGAIVSGAYFGDKLSPLSDTTVVASSTAGVNIYDHIKHMLYVSVPAFVISGILFGILGLRFAEEEMDYDQIGELTGTIAEHFNVGPLMFLPIVAVLIMILFRVPPIPALTGGCILGLIWALVFQGSGLADVFSAMNYGYVMDTGIEIVDELFTAGGLQSMMWTISLILVALAYGGIVEHTRMMEVMLEKILTVATTHKRLSIAAHVSTLIFILTVNSHYLTHVLTCRSYKHAFEEKGLHPKNVSRISEAWGTLPSSLIPWGPCGAFVYGTLGVYPFDYLPFAFFILIAMALSFIYGLTGFSMHKLDDEDAAGIAGD